MIVDIIIIILLIFGVLFGLKKGLVSMVVGLLALILSVMLAFLLQGPISNTLYNNTPLGKTIETNVQTMIEKNIQSGDDIKDNKLLEAVLSQETIENGLVNQPSKLITMFILKGISFLSILIAVYIVCSILQLVLNTVFNLPVLHSINKIGGAGVGALQTILKIWIIFAIIYFLSPIPWVGSVKDFVTKGAVSNTLYENNIFVNIIKTTMKI